MVFSPLDQFKLTAFYFLSYSGISLAFTSLIITTFFATSFILVIFFATSFFAITFFATTFFATSFILISFFLLITKKISIINRIGDFGLNFSLLVLMFLYFNSTSLYLGATTPEDRDFQGWLHFFTSLFSAGPQRAGVEMYWMMVRGDALHSYATQVFGDFDKILQASKKKSELDDMADVIEYRELTLKLETAFQEVERWYDGGRENYKNSYHPIEELKPNFDPKGKICAEFVYFQEFCYWIDMYSRITNRKLYLLTKITGSLLPEDLAYGKSLNMTKKINDTDIANNWLQFNLEDTQKNVLF